MRKLKEEAEAQLQRDIQKDDAHAFPLVVTAPNLETGIQISHSGLRHWIVKGQHHPSQLAGSISREDFWVFMTGNSAKIFGLHTVTAATLSSWM